MSYRDYKFWERFHKPWYERYTKGLAKSMGVPDYVYNTVMNFGEARNKMREQAYQRVFGNLPKAPPKRSRSPTDDEQSINKKKMPGNGFVTHSAEHACVDLGYIKVKGKRRYRVNGKIRGATNKVLLQESDYITCSARRKKIFPLLTGKVGISATSNGVATFEIRPFTMNDVDIVDQANQFNTITFVEPTYDTATATGPTEAGTANQRIILKDQYMEFRIKNQSNDVPLYLNLYVYQLKSDIHAHPVSSLALAEKVAKGWNKNWDDEVTDPALYDDGEVPYGFSCKDNKFLRDECNYIGRRKNCLAHGQEGTFRVFIPGEQVHTSAHKLRAIPRSSSTYAPVAYKGGAYFVVYEMYGGIYTGDGDTPFSAADRAELEDVKMAIWGNFASYTQEVLSTAANPSNLAFAEKASIAAVDTGDIDIESHFVA